MRLSDWGENWGEVPRRYGEITNLLSPDLFSRYYRATAPANLGREDEAFSPG